MNPTSWRVEANIIKLPVTWDPSTVSKNSGVSYTWRSSYFNRISERYLFYPCSPERLLLPTRGPWFYTWLWRSTAQKGLWHWSKSQKQAERRLTTQREKESLFPISVSTNLSSLLFLSARNEELAKYLNPASKSVGFRLKDHECSFICANLC